MTSADTYGARAQRCAPRGWRRTDRHYQAVLLAEVQRLVRELQVSGPLMRTTLARRCRATSWSQGSLDAAIQRGVREGALTRLPFDFIDVPRTRHARQAESA